MLSHSKRKLDQEQLEEAWREAKKKYYCHGFGPGFAICDGWALWVLGPRQIDWFHEMEWLYGDPFEEEQNSRTGDEKISFSYKPRGPSFA